MNRRAWTGASLGARWQHRFFYGLIRRCGRKAAYGLADLVSLYYVLAKPSVRARCRPYLLRRFGAARPVDAWRLSRAFARVLVDRAAVGLLGRDVLHSTFTGRETLNDLLSEGKGLILMMAHVGAWQLGMANLTVVQAPVTVVMHRNPEDVDRQYFEHGQGEAPFQVLDPDTFMGGSLDMLKILQRGEVLCVMGDRVMSPASPTVEVSFLGAPIRLPYGPFKLASLTGAPVVVAFPYKPSPDCYELRVFTVIRVPPKLGRRSEAFRPYAQSFVDAMETFTQDFPYHFFNFFDMWASIPAEDTDGGA